MGGGLNGLYLSWHTNYHCASLLYRVLFSTQTGTFCWATFGSRSLLHLVVPQQTSRRSLHAFCAPWPCCSPTWNAQSRKFWRQITLPVLLVLADYWSRGVWTISQVPLTPGQSQVINWIAQVGGYRLNKFHGAIIFAHVLTTQLCWLNVVELPWFADSANITTRAVPLICMAAVVQLPLECFR